MSLNNNNSNSRDWRIVALTSGTFAALNGVFAKLTTSTFTSNLTRYLSNQLHLSNSSSSAQALEYAVRCLILILSFVLSSTMWALYTSALASAPSAVHANVVNTSTNFLVAALCGWALFGEELSLTWFVGAALLISGTVVIGRRSGGGQPQEEEDEEEEETKQKKKRRRSNNKRQASKGVGKREASKGGKVE